MLIFRVIWAVFLHWKSHPITFNDVTFFHPSLNFSMRIYTNTVLQNYGMESTEGTSKMSTSINTITTLNGVDAFSCRLICILCMVLACFGDVRASKVLSESGCSENKPSKEFAFYALYKTFPADTIIREGLTNLKGHFSKPCATESANRISVPD